MASTSTPRNIKAPDNVDDFDIGAHAAAQIARQRAMAERAAAINNDLAKIEAKRKNILDRAKVANREQTATTSYAASAAGALIAHVVLTELRSPSVLHVASAVNSVLAKASSAEAKRLKELMGTEVLTLANLREWLGISVTKRTPKAVQAEASKEGMPVHGNPSNTGEVQS
jgi:hypothetical protein